MGALLGVLRESLLSSSVDEVKCGIVIADGTIDYCVFGPLFVSQSGKRSGHESARGPIHRSWHKRPGNGHGPYKEPLSGGNKDFIRLNSHRE
jgi:hypothetical protein